VNLFNTTLKSLLEKSSTSKSPRPTNMSDIPEAMLHRNMLIKATEEKKRKRATVIQSENKRLLNNLMHI